MKTEKPCISYFAASELKEFILDAISKGIAAKSDFDIQAEFIPRKQAAKVLDVSLSTLDTLTKKGDITAYKLGSAVRYKPLDLVKSFKPMHQ